MYVIQYKGTIYDSYYIGKGLFATDKSDKRIKKYETREECEKALQKIEEESKGMTAGVSIIEIK